MNGIFIVTVLFVIGAAAVWAEDQSTRTMELNFMEGTLKEGGLSKSQSDIVVDTCFIFGKMGQETKDGALNDKIAKTFEPSTLQVIRNVYIHGEFSEELERLLNVNILRRSPPVKIKALTLSDTNFDVHFEAMRSLEALTIIETVNDKEGLRLTDPQLSRILFMVKNYHNLRQLRLPHLEPKQFAQLTEMIKERDNVRLTVGTGTKDERLCHLDGTDALTVTYDTYGDDMDSQRLLVKPINELTVLVGSGGAIATMATPYFMRHVVDTVNVVSRHGARTVSDVDTFHWMVEKLEVNKSLAFRTLKMQTFIDPANRDALSVVRRGVTRMLSQWTKMARVIVEFLYTPSAVVPPPYAAPSRPRPPLTDAARYVCGDGALRYRVDMAHNTIECFRPPAAAAQEAGPSVLYRADAAMDEEPLALGLFG